MGSRKIKGLDKAKRRLRKMQRKFPNTTKSAMTDAVVMIQEQAKENVTGGNPLFVKSGSLKSNIHHRVTQTGGDRTVGTVGIPSAVHYGKVHELGQPAFIYPKKGKYLRFQAGTRGMSPAVGRRMGKWVSVKQVEVKKRPWLRPAAEKMKPRIRRRFDRLTQDLLKAAR